MLTHAADHFNWRAKGYRSVTGVTCSLQLWSKNGVRDDIKYT